MQTQTMSKLILSVILLLAMSAGCYWISVDVNLFGAVLLLGGLGILIWVWKPWQWFGR
ncbi:MAG: hypothetical protein R3335_03645 [Anaerolineales bacterium]|nr:hypothetical protein [Anaerolineales bacterium]